MDLALWLMILLVFESIIVLASTRWFPGQPYTVSLVPAVTAIVLVRWGPWAAVHAAAGGIVLCFLSGASLSRYAVYAIGNLLCLALLPWLSRWRKTEGVWKSAGAALAYGAAVLVTMQAGRAAVTLMQGAAPALALGCFTTEAITDLFTLVILWIVRRLDGVLEDQHRYVERIREEERRQRG